MSEGDLLAVFDSTLKPRSRPMASHFSFKPGRGLYE